QGVDPELERDPVAPLPGSELAHLAPRLDREPVARRRDRERERRIDRPFAVKRAARRAGDPGGLAAGVRREPQDVDGERVALARGAARRGSPPPPRRRTPTRRPRPRSPGLPARRTGARKSPPRPRRWERDRKDRASGNRRSRAPPGPGPSRRWPTRRRSAPAR